MLPASILRHSCPFHPFPARRSRVPSAPGGMLVELGGVWARQMEAPALGGHRPCMWTAPAKRVPCVLQEQHHQGRLLLLRLLGLAGGAGCPPPSAVWWVYARVRHPKAAFETANNNMQRRTACPGPEPAAVLPARPPADQRGCLRHNITLRCQHEPNMAASITCAASKGHLCIIGTCANAESRQKCHLGSITWPRVLLAAQAGLARQLEGGQAAPPLVLGQGMQSCAACRC